MENLDLEVARRHLDKFLREKEGEKLKPYRCSAGIPTIGVGATTYPDGRKVTMRDAPITREQMDRMLATEIERAIDIVLEMVDHEVTTGQLVALVSCGYNIGFPALAGSSMTKAHKRGDYVAAAQAFTLWDKAKDPKTGQLVQVPGLLARRSQEAAAYLSDSLPVTRPVQAVAPESNLAKSPIMQAGVVAVAGGSAVLGAVPVDPPAAAVAVPQAAAAASTPVRIAAEALGISPTLVAGLILILCGAVVVYWRFKQRQAGRA